MTIQNIESVAILLTVEEAAQRLGIGRTKMFALIASGDVESVTTGRLRRVPPACLTAYVSTLLATGQHEQVAA